MAGNGTGETPAMTLQRIRPGFDVVADHSVAGTMLSMLTPDFAQQPRSASIVVIENGVIDGWNSVPGNLFATQLRALIVQVKSEGRTPVLTGFARQVPNPILDAGKVSLRDNYDLLARSVADATGTEFADWGSVPFQGAPELLDGVHPNKGYSDRLVEQLALTLDKVDPSCSAPAAASAEVTATN